MDDVAGAAMPARPYELVDHKLALHCSDEMLLKESASLLAAFSVECEADAAAAAPASDTPLSSWARLVHNADDPAKWQQQQQNRVLLVASAGGPTAQLLFDALTELRARLGTSAAPRDDLALAPGAPGLPGVMYRPLPAAKRWLETRGIKVGKAVYVVDDPREVAAWAFQVSSEDDQKRGGAPNNDRQGLIRTRRPRFSSTASRP